MRDPAPGRVRAAAAACMLAAHCASLVLEAGCLSEVNRRTGSVQLAELCFRDVTGTSAALDGHWAQDLQSTVALPVGES